MLLNEEMASGVMPDDAIFALDIGTRTVIGVVGVEKADGFLVNAVEIVSHETRAMLDGQIHDIAKVVEGVSKVKSSLESKLGYPLTRVSIAAAGRVLKTCQIRVDRDIEEGLEIDGQLISALEMEAIQKAQFKIESELSQKEKDQYYCVGYSVVNYYLNDYIISSLLGHRGIRTGVEVLATFLPNMVVDSLYTVMERTGLEVTHLTLEPIAALNLAIPKDLRLLNLALVDIGAGTSDIAITKGGTVVAYAMVPVAGDELTEAIAQNYLVDFNTAEDIKITLFNKESITFTDILDNKISITRDDVNQCLHPVVEQLAKTIAAKILEFNGGKSPNAVFLVGGGSQATGLCEALSSVIGLPKERVAVRNRSIAKNITLEEDVLKGPESITPLGIMVTTAMVSGQDFFYVTVNDSKVRMFNSRRMTVADALILAGFNADQLICKSGKSLKIYINGKDKTFRGSIGEPAEIYVNNSISNLNAVIVPGDVLTVVPARNGLDAVVHGSDLVSGYSPIYLEFNDHTENIYPSVIVDGNEVGRDTVLLQGQKVEIRDEITLEEITKRYEMDTLLWKFKVNGLDADNKTTVRPGDHIKCTPRTPEEQPVHPVIEDLKETTIAEDIKSMIEKTASQLAEREGIYVTVNGKTVNLPPKSTGYMFIDLFNHTDFDLTTPKGAIVLLLNGKDANYTDSIKSGDIVEIFWRK